MSTDKEEVEIFTVVKLPRGHYQVATGLTRIYNYADFDEYVSETIKEQVETLLDGVEPVYDSIHRKLTGEPSEHTKEINKKMEPIIETINQIKQEEQEDKEDNSKEDTS